MIQVLTPRDRERAPSVGERLSAGIGRGLEMGSQLFKEYEANKLAKQQRQMEDARFKELTGLDISGINDPKMREKAFELALQGQNRQKELSQKQDFLTKIFNPNQESSVEKTSEFNPSNISDAQIAMASAVDPNLGRILQQQKDVGLREKREQEKLELQKQKMSPEFKREERLASSQAEADVKYNQQLQESSKQHELKEQTLDRLEKLNKKGVTGKPYEKLLEKSGLVALTSEGRREFAADVKNLITDIRSILGSQFTGFEFQTILNAYPSPDFSQEANAAIIKNLKDFQDIKKKEVEIANKLKKENNGKVPVDFQAKVNEMVHDYAQTKLPDIKNNMQKIMAEEYGVTPGNVLMFDPQGEPLDVHPSQIQKYIDLGATLGGEI